ncbi:TetR/AcrR family transcriptional regulator [Glutamicibacter sp.]|uniref:TetR/AcrR family transcriptional regulator n=1 Tax=Glutamicibacter sp. TaxID=1931995 RepID=UPI002FE28F6B
MTTNPPRKATGPKPQYSSEKIVDIALRLADAQGLQAVSLRAIATQLGTGAASLYRYVKSFENLTELMLDRISGEYDFETHSGHGIEQLVEIAHQTRQIMTRHTWAPILALTKPSMGPNSLAYLERGLMSLEKTSLSANEKLHTLAMLNAMTAAFVLNELSQKDPPDASQMMLALQSGAYPHLLATLSEVKEPLDAQSSFEQAIVAYLHGVGLADHDHAQP